VDEKQNELQQVNITAPVVEEHSPVLVTDSKAYEPCDDIAYAASLGNDQTAAMSNSQQSTEISKQRWNQTFVL
jgi:hypothetical protein